MKELALWFYSGWWIVRVLTLGLQAGLAYWVFINWYEDYITIAGAAFLFLLGVWLIEILVGLLLILIVAIVRKGPPVE